MVDVLFLTDFTLFRSFRFRCHNHSLVCLSECPSLPAIMPRGKQAVLSPHDRRNHPLSDSVVTVGTSNLSHENEMSAVTLELQDSTLSASSLPPLVIDGTAQPSSRVGRGSDSATGSSRSRARKKRTKTAASQRNQEDYHSNSKSNGNHGGTVNDNDGDSGTDAHSSKRQQQQERSLSLASHMASLRAVQTTLTMLSRSQKPKIDFLKDPIDEMTYGRRIALALMNKPWYNVQLKRRQEEQEKCDTLEEEEEEEREEEKALVGKARNKQKGLEEEKEEIELTTLEESHLEKGDTSSESNSIDVDLTTPQAITKTNNDNENNSSELMEREEENELFPIQKQRNDGSVQQGRDPEQPTSTLKKTISGNPKANSDLFPWLDNGKKGRIVLPTVKERSEHDQPSEEHSESSKSHTTAKKPKRSILRQITPTFAVSTRTSYDNYEKQRRPPKVSHDDHPSLEKAWAFFEHVTLPRYTVDEDYMGTGNRKRKSYQVARAEPGEDQDKTLLYDPIHTHSSQLGDFGIGVGLYFSTVRAVAVLLLLAGILNIPTMLYFSSEKYSPDGHRGINYPLRGSAICTDTEWVPCHGCPSNKFHSSRFAEAIGVAENSLHIIGNETTVDLRDITFAQHNNCTFRMQEGLISFATTVLMVVGMAIVSYKQEKQEVVFDEDEQTAQDYSVQVRNPPGDARDPEEWREFFQSECDASPTIITVAVDNDLLLNALVERREYLRRMELMVEPGTKLDNLSLALLAAQQAKARSPLQRYIHQFIDGVPELYSRQGSIEAKLEGLAQLDYEVRNVFVTFETEADQRRVLTLLNAAPFDAFREESYKGIKFRNKHVLLVKEPHEPNTILWENLNESFSDLVKAMVGTTTVWVTIIAGVAWLLNTIHLKYSHVTYAIVVNISNQVFPRLARFLTSFEDHKTEGHLQTSLYFKINLFRWITTAVVISLVTRFDRTLTPDGLIQTVYPIFQGELITSNLLHLLDMSGHFQRHFLAPRAKTQGSMNLRMKGAYFSLAERFTVSVPMQTKSTHALVEMPFSCLGNL